MLNGTPLETDADLIDSVDTSLDIYRGLTGASGTLPPEVVNQAAIEAASSERFCSSVLGHLGARCFRRLQPPGDEGWPRTCNGNRCLTCSPRRAFWMGAAIDLAQPTHLVTLTDIGHDWDTVHTRMKTVITKLRRTGATFELAWHVERNPRRDGAHVHWWHRGTIVATDWLSEISRSVGGGREVDITNVTRRSASGMGYGLKAVASTNHMSIPAAIAEQATYRHLNGGRRLVHPTRDFWLDERGERTTLAQALLAAKAAHRQRLQETVA
ncbi:hypothetical protein [Actinospongicola halichondriae]|uniref:hypothetical protein n=1 Tax=Actinospongicola halichondriae TaxID=3236844 RepID=UPI003D3D71F6